MWIFLSVLTAIFYALEGAWGKVLTKKVNRNTITWAMFTFGIPYILIAAAFTGVPEIKNDFYWSALLSVAINMVAFTIFVKALKISPLTLTYPFLSFSPVFLIFTGYIFLGEIPSMEGVIGIILITGGAYVLNISGAGRGLLAPVKAIKKEKGSLLMFIVSLMWSFAATFDKVAVLSSSPFFYLVVFNISFFLFYMPYLYHENPDFISEVKSCFPQLVLLGALGGLMVIFQMTALKAALVSYVIAIKRSGMLFTMLIGHFLFKEKAGAARVIGTLLMVAGIFMISFFS